MRRSRLGFSLEPMELHVKSLYSLIAIGVVSFCSFAPAKLMAEEATSANRR